MNDEPNIEGLIMTLDLCEHYLPKDVPPIHHTHLRRIRRMLRELAGTAQHSDIAKMLSPSTDQGSSDDR